MYSAPLALDVQFQDKLVKSLVVVVLQYFLLSTIDLWRRYLRQNSHLYIYSFIYHLSFID